MDIYKFSQLFPHLAFPIQVIRVENQTDIDFHNHDFHEIVLICAGVAEHETHNGKSKLAAGDIIVVPQGKSHRYSNSKKLMLYNFVINTTKIALPVMDALLLPGFKILTGKESKETHFKVSKDTLGSLVQLTNELQSELKERKSGYQFAATAIFMKIILTMAREFPADHYEAASFTGNDVFKLVEFMEKNITRKISMETLARQIHVSEPTLFRHFKNYLGCTPNSYILQLRVSKAAELLTQSDMSLDEIALKTGFCDANHLSKTFTRFTGDVPSKYRKLGK